jgi:hypothetical protein
MAKRAKNRQQWEQHITRKQTATTTRTGQNQPRIKAEQPKCFKVTNGVEWFHVEHEGHMPHSRSGTPRNFRPGIYLDMIGTPQAMPDKL